LAVWERTKKHSKGPQLGTGRVLQKQSVITLSGWINLYHKMSTDVLGGMSGDTAGGERRACARAKSPSTILGVWLHISLDQMRGASRLLFAWGLPGDPIITALAQS
jgi:hypothetical protein